VPRHLRNALVLAASGAVFGLAACGSDGGDCATTAASPKKVRGSGQALPELEAQSSQLLDGGAEAFERRLADLRGHPIVVNQWASWCGPCRFEFPFFQSLAAKYEGRVAFLGVNSQDSRDEAEEFLEEFPVPYPHYFDPDAEVARVFEGGRAWPTTAYYDAGGELVQTHEGAYADEASLESDIKRFALGG
jgi:cytochrome c biogenesis protein CcmG/thiol:disulfide interchange protein DsbE